MMMLSRWLRWALLGLSPFAAYSLATGWLRELAPWTASLFLGIWSLSVLTSAVAHRQDFWGFAALTWTVTWVLEVVGVRTGFPFGSYRYTGVLQPELAGVPVVIPLAWLGLLLVGIVWTTYRRAAMAPLEHALRLGLWLVGVDVLLEPMASHIAGYWRWTSGTVPVQNYLTWGVVALLLTLLYRRWLGERLPAEPQALWVLGGLLVGLCALVDLVHGYVLETFVGMGLIGLAAFWRQKA
jgi:uncharacterized membrane protein